MNHLIRQQYLHVTVSGSEADGLALQARLPELCRHWLLPALEQALDRHAPPDGHLLIGRLDLDLGQLPPDRLEQDLAATVAQALDLALREQAPPEPWPSALPPGNVQRRTNQQAVAEAFLYFLQTGRLPWSFRLPPGQDLEQALLAGWPPGTATPVAPAAFRQVLALAPARQRLLGQFSPQLLQALLRQLFPPGAQVLSQVLEKLPPPEVPPFYLPAPDLELFEKRLREAALLHLAQGRPPAEKELVTQAWQASPLPPRSQQAFGQLLEGYWPGATEGKGLIAFPPLEAAAPRAGSHARQESPPDTRRVPEAVSLTEQDAGEELFIDNAGLVLLHPFLPRFFEHLGLAQGDRLVKPAKALQLLHLLATGQAAAPEYELVLPKVLCQIPLETPVEKETGLTKEEREEAEALLQAVIRHWEALKGTSPDGLRGTFLVRPGKLSRRPDGDWLLQVESQSYDILLGQLPWAISMIKLPWMQQMLWVEWNT